MVVWCGVLLLWCVSSIDNYGLLLNVWLNMLWLFGSSGVLLIDVSSVWCDVVGKNGSVVCRLGCVV